MTEAPDPVQAREIVDRLEDEILDVAGAADEGTDRSAQDVDGAVPGAPEPPD